MDVLPAKRPLAKVASVLTAMQTLPAFAIVRLLFSIVVKAASKLLPRLMTDSTAMAPGFRWALMTVLLESFWLPYRSPFSAFTSSLASKTLPSLPVARMTIVASPFRVSSIQVRTASMKLL